MGTQGVARDIMAKCCPKPKARWVAGKPPAAIWWHSCSDKRAWPLVKMQDTPRPPASFLLWSSCQASLSRYPSQRKEPEALVAFTEGQNTWKKIVQLPKIRLKGGAVVH